MLYKLYVISVFLAVPVHLTTYPKPTFEHCVYYYNKNNNQDVGLMNHYPKYPTSLKHDLAEFTCRLYVN